jgi:hypothetical protein
MNCADLEILLADYIDGTLAPEAKAEVEAHLAQCAACSEMARDISAAVEFIGRAEDVEPPPELMTRILFELPAAHKARAKKPGGLRMLVHHWLQPVLQPKFAMGFAMTILSFSLLARIAGISPRQLTVDDLRPARIWAALDDRAYRAWQRTVKFYESLRVVYEVQNQLRDWTQQEQGRGIDDAPATSPDQPADGAARPQQQPPAPAAAQPSGRK